MKKIEVTYKEPGGIIWKILPDETRNYLAVESRDGERRKTILSVLNLSNSDFLYSNNELPKPWWIGLIAVEENKIIFQGYKESNSPEPIGFYIFDLKSGELKQKEEEKVYELSDVLTDQLSFFPLLYNEENVHYATIAGFLKNIHNYTCTGPMEYLEFENYIMISFYIQENKKMTNILLILTVEGDEVLTDRLIEGVEGVGLASFFICKKKLIYIKNKTSIALADL